MEKPRFIVKQDASSRFRGMHWRMGNGNVVLCECGKMREMGKMCHVMSIDEKVRCICL